MGAKLAEIAKIVCGNLSLANALAIDSKYISMKNVERVAIVIGLAPASGTDACAITLKQSSSVANSPAVEKALSFTTVKKCTDFTTLDTLTDTDVTANSITTSAAAAKELYVIDIKASDLDVANGFDCLRVAISDPGSVSTPAFVLYIAHPIRFGANDPPTLIAD